MESFEGPSQVNRANLLQVPTGNNSTSEDEDVNIDIKLRFSPRPRRRSSSASEEEEEVDTPTNISRKVSFADAFGFDLVSVKEFDTWEFPNTGQENDTEDEVFPQDEYFFSQQFTLPASQEELLQKVREQKVMLESVLLLPGITCMNGVIRVLNVSFEKQVYVRMTLNNWLSYYDILAEFMPNSCGSETDQFCFKISLVPPFQKDGLKVEFCIRYETSVGTFWANNDDKNYTLICHKKETVPKVDNKTQKEVTDRSLKGCLKTTQRRKEEILATSDDGTWNKSRTSDTNIPEIVYSQAEDKDTKQANENIKERNAEYNQGDYKDDEKELELLLNQHFTEARGTSSRDERNLYTTEPINFPSETERLVKKLTCIERSSALHPVPISSSSENTSHAIGEELKDKVKYSVGDYNSQLPGKEVTAGSVNSYERSLEHTGTSESLLSAKHFPVTKQNEAIKITATGSSRQGERHTDISKGEIDSALGSKMTERLFISEDAAGTSKGACEMRPETISPEHDESVQLNACIARTLDGNANPALEHQAPQMSHQTVDSLLSDADKNENEGKIKMIESKVQVHLRGDLYAGTFAHAGVSTDSTHKKGIGEMSEKNSNTGLAKEKKVIEVADLASIGEEDASKPFKSHRKHNAKALNPVPLPAENKQAPRDTRVDERQPEDTQEHRGFKRLKGREKPDNANKGRPIGRESEANSAEQRWQETGSEIWWRVRGSVEPQSMTSTKELFTCQEAESCEKSSVSEQGITEEAEAGTAYIIKTTSESAPEKMPGSEKAVIAKLPRETALSDRPTEEKETAFDTHEGRNDGSHYALCQLNTVGVLYDTEFEKESVLGIYNACVHETLQGEMKSVCSSREKCAKAQPDNILPVGEAVKASATEKKEDLQRGLCSDVPKSPLSTQKHLYCEKAEELYREESHVDTLSCLYSKAETKMPPSGTNTVPSYHYKSSSVASSEGPTVEGGMEHLHRHFESKVIEKVAAESGYNSNLTNEIMCINKNFSSEVEKGEVPSTSDTAISGEGRGRSTGQSFHQAELQQEKSWRPEALISKSTKENEGTDSRSDHLITEGKTRNWLDDSQKESQHTSDSADISNQKSEALKLSSESPGLKHTAFKIFYVFLFLLFAGTLYHYDLIVCLALYLFSLYWLCHEGRRNKESVKKQ
ncbi:protein phosphatase 1 regulatory subunit 3A [Corvus moneduloides]|uniref:Protein phosphatase 1 regulatory subunit 3A n=1 Tax=Corvus moneduloides TaxID=1196302 RepID=A0A8U7N021_CORMO|nr:protein phosphatase 1 regulatory subunit 3A [Corvus moneduloides]